MRAVEACRTEYDKATEAQTVLTGLLEHTREMYRNDAHTAVAELAAEARGEGGVETESTVSRSTAEEELRRLANEEPETIWAMLTGSQVISPVGTDNARKESTRLKEIAVEAMQKMQENVEAAEARMAEMVVAIETAQGLR